jgi:hypothetical protein
MKSNFAVTTLNYFGCKVTIDCNDSFFVYGEDVELSYRGQRGKLLLKIPDKEIVWHRVATLPKWPLFLRIPCCGVTIPSNTCIENSQGV